jgi:hypothetical protein
MNTRLSRLSFVTAAVLAVWSVFALAGNNVEPAFAAATTQQKVEARQQLNQVISLLRSVDTAYASGNATEAQTRFEQARSAWNQVAPAISAREAREAQLLFDSLGTKLQKGASPADVKKTVSGMLEELNEDIAGELR